MEIEYIYYQQMENQDKNNQYHQTLNQILIAPSLESINIFIHQDPSSIEQSLFACDKTFFGRVEWTLILAKRKILMLLGQKYPLLSDTQLDIFKTKIRPLTYFSGKLVKEGIFSMYNQFLDLLQTIERNKLSSQFSDLIQQTIQIIQPILRDYFLIKKMDNMLHSEKQIKQILSQKIINTQSHQESEKCSSSKEFQNYEIFKLINKEIQDRTIQELIDDEIDRKILSNDQTYETCRICEEKIALNKLEKHLTYCTKKEVLRAERDEIVDNQDQIVAEIKEELLKGCKNQKLNRIFKAIVLSFTKSEKMQRRNSHIQNFRAEESDKKLSVFLEEAEQIYPNNYLIERLNSFEKQRSILEKKIQQLEYQFVSGSNDSIDSSSRSIRSSRKHLSKAKNAQTIKTKKSLFAPKQYSEDIESSQKNSTLKTIKDKKTQKFGLQKWNSIKDERNEKDKQQIASFFNIEEQKMYKSLTSINFEEQKKIETKFKNFEVLKFLGKGAFGKVYLVRRKNTMDIYAMKVIKIQKDWSQSELNLIEKQHQVFKKIGGDYLVNSSFSFNEGSAHFFVLEYMPRGDLSKILQQEVYLEYNQAKFYLAEIILALEHLHCFQIVHRDLKPENLVIDDKGHLKLTDFGLSQIGIKHKIDKARLMDYNKTTQHVQENLMIQDNSGMCVKNKICSQKKSNLKIIGTPDYIAPEIIEKVCLNNPSSDWWSLGVLTYQMLVGCRPFSDDTVDQVIDNILQLKMTWPQIGDGEEMISPIAADLIKKLLNPDYQRRLGAKNVQQIKEHPFFEGVDWQNIRQRTPPFLPKSTITSQIYSMQADQSLHIEIQEVIKNKKSNSRAPSLRVSNFINYNFLMNETLDSAERNIQQNQRKIIRMKTYVQNQQNKKQVDKRKRASIDVVSFLLPDDCTEQQ